MYAVDSRYPDDDWQPYGQAEAKSALALAQEIRDQVVSLLDNK